MKTVVHSERSRDRLLHIEAEGCIINIRVGLIDSQGRKVTSVEVLPDRYAGDEWDMEPGPSGFRIIQRQAQAV